MRVVEGYTTRTRDAQASASATAARTEAIEIARHNLDMMLTTLESVQHSPQAKVVVRLGHATHATNPQIARMAKLGVVVEANIGSNLRTGAILSIDEYPLLSLLWHKVPVTINTDAGGTMNTSMRAEVKHHQDILAKFRRGDIHLQTERGPLLWGQLSRLQQQRFSVGRLFAAARRYRAQLRLGRGPTQIPTPIGRPLDQDKLED